MAEIKEQNQITQKPIKNKEMIEMLFVLFFEYITIKNINRIFFRS